MIFTTPFYPKLLQLRLYRQFISVKILQTFFVESMNKQKLHKKPELGQFKETKIFKYCCFSFNQKNNNLYFLFTILNSNQQRSH